MVRFNLLFLMMRIEDAAVVWLKKEILENICACCLISALWRLLLFQRGNGIGNLAAVAFILIILCPSKLGKVHFSLFWLLLGGTIYDTSPYIECVRPFKHILILNSSFKTELEYFKDFFSLSKQEKVWRCIKFLTPTKYFLIN